MVNRPLVRAWLRLCALLLALLPAAAAELSLRLPDPCVAGPWQEATLTLRDAGSFPRRITLPEIDGVSFELDPQPSQQMASINGQTTTTLSYRLSVRAAAPGTYAIGAVTATLPDGTSLRSAPTTLHAEAPRTDLAGDGVAEASFSPATVVPGQAVELTLRIILREGAPLLEPLPVAPPEGTSPNGTPAIPRTWPPSQRLTDASGGTWLVWTLRWPLIASAPGAHTVSGQIPWRRIRGQDFFGELVLERAVQHLPLRSTTLTVAALPDAGRPDDFSGVVGALTAAATLDRDRIAAGEGVQLTLTIGGAQAALLPAPRPVLPPGLTAYPKPGEDADGRRAFRFDLVPAAPGTYAIPTLSFPWFDPTTRTYRRAETAPLTLTVLPGRSRAAPTVTATPTAGATGPALPPPWRGRAPATVSGGWILAAAATGLAAAALAGLLLRPRRRAGPDHAAALRAAVARGDAEAIATALAALVPADAAAAATLRQRVDAARFGGAALGDDIDALAQRVLGSAK